MALPPRRYVLKLPRMSYRIGRRVLTLWLVLAILFAQGLRLCLHVYDGSAPQTYAAGTASSHLEATLGTHDDEASSNAHVPLLSLLKNLVAEPLVAIVFAVLLIVMLAPPRVARPAWSHDIVLRPRFGHHFAPPLRAPPR